MDKPKTKEPWKEPRLSPERINEIALGIFNGEILTSSQIPERDSYLLPMIFMPIGFLADELTEEFKTHPPALIYGCMKNAGPRSINGYPIFFEAGMVHKKDAQLIRQKYEALQAAIKEILKP